uniref:HP domain-containing protein n=1 Tax=Anisakis simplex TaxID=6269 RepID=A0A0M3K408_ANISI
LVGIMFKNVPFMAESVLIDKETGDILRLAALSVVVVRAAMGFDLGLFKKSNVRHGVGSHFCDIFISSIPIDNLLCILAFSVSISVVFAVNIPSQIGIIFAQLAIGTIVGITAGVTMWLFPKCDGHYSHFLRFLLIMNMSFASLFASNTLHCLPAGIVASILLTVISALRWRIDNRSKTIKEERAFAVLFDLFAVPILFGLIGYDFGIAQLDMRMVLEGFAIAGIGMLVRTVIAFILSFFAGLSLTEQALISVILVSKATIQAVLSPYIVDACSERTECDDRTAVMMRTVCVFAIIITAPLGKSCEKWRTRVHKDEQLSKLTSSLTPTRLRLMNEPSGVHHNNNNNNDLIDITKGLDDFYGGSKPLTDRENNSVLLTASPQLLSDGNNKKYRLKTPNRARAPAQRRGHHHRDKRRVESSKRRDELSKLIKFSAPQILIDEYGEDDSKDNFDVDDLILANGNNNENDMDNSAIAPSAIKGLQSKLDYTKVKLNRIEYKRVYPEVMLIRIKGEKHVDVRLVAPKITSLHHYAVFVLIKPDRLFLFNGKHANLMEKSMGMQFVNNIISKNGELGCKAKRVEEMRSDALLSDGADFWKILTTDTDNEATSLSDSIESNAEELLNLMGEYRDEPFENLIASEVNIVFRIDQNSMIAEIVSCLKIPDYRLLQPDANFIFDFGSEIYVWYGRSANRNGTRQAVLYAKELLNGNVAHLSTNSRALFGEHFKTERRPKWCSLVKLSQGLSDILFESKFVNWKRSAKKGTALIRQPAKHISNIHAINCSSNQSNDEQISYALGSKLAENRSKESVLLVDGDEIERIASNVFTEGLKVWVLNSELGAANEVNDELIQLWPCADDASINNYAINKCCVFYENMCYIIKWDFRIERKNVHKLDGTKRNVKTGRSRRVYFFWLGLQTTKKQQGLCALALRNIDKERVQHERIVQNEEPYAFVQLFRGNLIIRGCYDTSNANSSVRALANNGLNEDITAHLNIASSEDGGNASGHDIGLFVLIGSTQPDEYRLIELNTDNNNNINNNCNNKKYAILRSHAVYVIISWRTNEIFIWYGRESLFVWREAALRVVSNIVAASNEVEDGESEHNADCANNNYGFNLKFSDGKEEIKIIELDQNEPNEKVLNCLKNSRLNIEYFDGCCSSSCSDGTYSSSSDNTTDNSDKNGGDTSDNDTKQENCDIELAVISAKNWKQPPRLIRLFDYDGDYVPCQQWDTQMPFTFHQYHLRDTMLVDQGTILWVWSERVVSTHSLRVAKSYWQSCQHDSAAPIYVICKRYEPIEFKALFCEWNDFDCANDNTDDDDDEGEVKFEMCELDKLLAERTKYFTVDELRRRDLPSGIDLKHLEEYLNETDFVSVFCMQRSQFYALPAWKQIQLRKQNDLF